jgi:hypothetical protein
MRSFAFLFMVSAFVILASVRGYTDTILFKNNTQLIGKIISESAEEILLDVNGVPLRVRRVDVASISRGSGTFPTIEEIENSIPTSDSIPGQSYIPSEQTIPFVTDETQTAVPEAVFDNPILETADTAKPVVEEPTETKDLPILPLLLPQGRAYQVSGVGVNFRKGPNLMYPPVEKLTSRSLLIEIEKQDDWLHAKTTTGTDGWIHTNFVTPLENVPCLVTGANLNLREGPGEIYRSMERLSKGDVVMKLGEQGDFYRVLYNDSMVGFCHTEFLEPLTDASVYRPPMPIIGNEEAGSPILVMNGPEGILDQKVALTVRDDNIVLNGITKVMVLFSDKETFDDPMLNYRSEAIVQKQRIGSPVEIMNNGLPEQLAISFIGCDVLTMLGTRASDGWQYEITIPAGKKLAYAFVVQKGPSRGAMVLVQ